jgi:hypothetical protein
MPNTLGQLLVLESLQDVMLVVDSVATLGLSKAKQHLKKLAMKPISIDSSLNYTKITKCTRIKSSPMTTVRRIQTISTVIPSEDNNTMAAMIDRGHLHNLPDPNRESYKRIIGSLRMRTNMKGIIHTILEARGQPGK